MNNPWPELISRNKEFRVKGKQEDKNRLEILRNPGEKPTDFFHKSSNIGLFYSLDDSLPLSAKQDSTDPWPEKLTFTW